MRISAIIELRKQGYEVPMIELTIVNQTDEKRWSRYRKDFVCICSKTEAVLSLKGNRNVSIIFVTPEAIHAINKDYRNIDRATDVISFALQDEQASYEMMEGEDELGDIFINIQAIVEQAKSYEHSLRREVCFLFTHGLLHLLGYDHMVAEDEQKMFQLQDVILDDIVAKKVHK